MNLKKQEILIKDTVKSQDIIICTALIPGKKSTKNYNRGNGAFNATWLSDL